MINQKRQIGFPMQVQEQMEICNAMKNMFHLQVCKEPIVLIEVPVKALQAGLTAVVEGVQVVLRDLHLLQEVVQPAFQDHPEPQAEALAWQVEAEVVPLLHQADLHLKDNLKNIL